MYCRQRETASRGAGLFGLESSKKRRTEQKLFPFYKITQKLENGKVFCGYFSKTFKRITSTPHLAKPMLSAVSLILFGFCFTNYIFISTVFAFSVNVIVKFRCRNVNFSCLYRFPFSIGFP